MCNTSSLSLLTLWHESYTPQINICDWHKLGRATTITAEQETKIQTLAVAKLVIISNSNPELLKQMIFNLIVNLKLQNSTEQIQLESCSQVEIKSVTVVSHGYRILFIIHTKQSWGRKSIEIDFWMVFPSLDWSIIAQSSAGRKGETLHNSLCVYCSNFSFSRIAVLSNNEKS